MARSVLWVWRNVRWTDRKCSGEEQDIRHRNITLFCYSSDNKTVEFLLVCFCCVILKYDYDDDEKWSDEFDHI